VQPRFYISRSSSPMTCFCYSSDSNVRHGCPNLVAEETKPGTGPGASRADTIPVHEELPQSVVDRVPKYQVSDRVSVDHVAGHDPDLAVVGGIAARRSQ